jgi:carbonic anhydrase
MKTLGNLFENNRVWAENIKSRDPDFFPRLARQQAPDYLWIGCSDSRVPANEIVGLLPGELFVHRNVANVVVHTDLNCLSVIQYAVEALKVRHIIVCGHYGCGGVKAAQQNLSLGLIDNWLRHVQDVANKHNELLSSIEDETERFNRLCELNVIEQAIDVCETTVVESAWNRGQDLAIHAWIYSITDGLLRDLSVSVKNQDELSKVSSKAMSR